MRGLQWNHGGDGHVHCLEGFRGVYKRPELSNCTLLNMCALLYVNYNSMKRVKDYPCTNWDIDGLETTDVCPENK